jgi:SAM-dependent methyltransferase
MSEAPVAGAAERQASDATSPYWGESAARYQFALQFAGPQTRALDVACGTGYGLRLLTVNGAHTIGVDADASAAREALRQDPGRTSLILRGDGCRLPFADARFSLVTSFETIEHLVDRGRFVGELRRILTPDGLLILSTPNANHTRPVNGKPSNPFHVHEYTPSELDAELRHNFGRVQLFGQILDGRFRIPPYWLDQQRLSRTPGVQARLLVRKLVNRLPHGPRDQLSQLLWGHSFFPAPSDYHIDALATETAQNLIALCWP